MEDWPELEELRRKRKEEKERFYREASAKDFVNRLEGNVDSLFELNQDLKPWRGMLEQLEGLTEEWGWPVYHLLQRMSEAAWEITPETQNRLQLETKIIVPSGCVPSLYWEALYQHFYSKRWYTVELQVDSRGQPV
jgi:hypothetical protein